MRSIKSLKVGLSLYHMQINFPHVGLIDVLTCENFVYAVCFKDELDLFLKRMKKKYAISIQKKSNNLMEKVLTQLTEYFSKSRKSFDLPIRLVGTEFQQNVWRVLMCIPYGQTFTYKQICERLELKNAFQAIGQAARINPLCLLVPCHRSVSANWDQSCISTETSLKSYLLSLEND